MRRKESGFTLIELALATLCTMVLMAAVFTLMTSLFSANAGMSDMMTTQQNVRVGLNTIARDITMAGTGLPSSGVAVPNGLNSLAITRPGMSAFASPDRNIVTENNTLPMLSPGNNAGPIIGTKDTDALTIFTLNQESPTWNITSIVGSSTKYDIVFSTNITTGTMALIPGDVLIFTNANGSVLGCLKDLDPTAANKKGYFRNTDAMGINQANAALGNIMSLANDGTTVFPPTTAMRVNLINYYINATTALHPKLMRGVNAEPAQVIAEDIENLQFSFDLYDFVLDSSTTNQDTTLFPNQIRSAYITLAGRSAERLLRSKDYFRFSLLTKINVRNATFRDRYVGS